MSSARAVESLAHHQTSRFVEAQSLLELQRRKRGHCFEVRVKVRNAHVSGVCQILDVQRLVVSRLQHLDRATDSLDRPVLFDELPRALQTIADRSVIGKLVLEV